MATTQTDATRVRRHVLVTGRVQGVFFRATTAEQARMRHVDGWVRNRADGRVEAVFEGREQDVAGMVEFCHSGPRGARVTHVDVRREPLLGEHGFGVD